MPVRPGVQVGPQGQVRQTCASGPECCLLEVGDERPACAFLQNDAGESFYWHLPLLAGLGSAVKVQRMQLAGDISSVVARLTKDLAVRTLDGEVPTAISRDTNYFKRGLEVSMLDLVLTQGMVPE
ncbi:hypothetical protein PoB_005348600 [Plakobranchus ocellatus]|uniref:Uncharacterized protein n=1 Tax=Plakobranchus ocellatus TaxID=259542 RepID=A0AAV4BUW4_9GAST|nr:hypothetical protein PoB_005348600 [Plakobranchus ocellatus]